MGPVPNQGTGFTLEANQSQWTRWILSIKGEDLELNTLRVPCGGPVDSFMVAKLPSLRKLVAKQLGFRSLVTRRGPGPRDEGDL